MDEKNDYEKLDAIPVPHHQTERPVGSFAATGHLMVPQTAEHFAPAMCDAAAAFIEAMSPSVSLFRKTNGREIGIKGDNWRDYYLSLDPGKDDLDSFALDVFAKGTIPVARFDGFGPFGTIQDRATNAPYGIVTFHFRLPRLKQDTEQFIARFASWCGILRPEQGTFGIGLVCKPGMERKRVVDYWPYLSRFSGLDQWTLMDWSAPEHHAGVRAVNWLTVLDDTWVERLGGLGAIGSGLHPEGRLHRYDGGVIVQACTHPQLGDVNMHGVPEAYAAVDALIAPHRYVDYPDKVMHLMKVPPPLEPHRATLDWLRRFEPKEG